MHGSCRLVRYSYEIKNKLLAKKKTKKKNPKNSTCIVDHLYCFLLSIAKRLNLMSYVLTQQEKIEDLNGAVVVVSFASKERTLEWKSITSCTYEILIDKERKLYKAVGLHSSVAKVCILKNI